MVTEASLLALSETQLRELAQTLIAQLASKDTAIAQSQTVIAQQSTELTWKQGKIDKLTQELALYRRWKFGAKTESLSAEQIQLFDETCAADIAEIETELEQLTPPAQETTKRQPKRLPIPPHLPRTEIHHEPESTTCRCGCQLKRIGEDVSEKLGYTPAGAFRRCRKSSPISIGCVATKHRSIRAQSLKPWPSSPIGSRVR